MDKKKLAPEPVAVNCDSQIVATEKPEEEVSSASSQAEIISASPVKKMPADMSNDELVNEVSGFFNKIVDELPYIIEIKHRFSLLKRNNANIAGCKSWKQFCAQRLHRTDRRIRQVLAANNAVDGKAKPVDATKKKREPGITPPAAASNWDAQETSRKCLAYVVNCLEHLGALEVEHALGDLIAKLQDERRMRQDPGPKKSAVKHRDTGKRVRGARP